MRKILQMCRVDKRTHFLTQLVNYLDSEIVLRVLVHRMNGALNQVLQFHRQIHFAPLARLLMA
jgi:hypothetical protein